MMSRLQITIGDTIQESCTSLRQGMPPCCGATDLLLSPPSELTFRPMDSPERLFRHTRRFTRMGTAGAPAENGEARTLRHRDPGPEAA